MNAENAGSNHRCCAEAANATDDRLRIAVVCDGFIDWTGGLDFLAFLVEALLAAKESAASIYLVIPTRRTTFPFHRTLRTVQRFASVMLNHRRLRFHAPPTICEEQVLDRLRHFDEKVSIVFYPKGRKHLVRMLRTISADVAFPSLYSLGKNFPYPWLGYIFDFQHRHLPQFFNRRTSRNRDKRFSAMLAEATLVICNSRAVRDDAGRFFPNSPATVVPLPFAPFPNPEWLVVDTSAVLARYGIASRYFIISNQFWVHKDHPTAFRALAALKESWTKESVKLVCTGLLDDHRFPAYIDDLRVLIDALKIDTDVLLLGHIPKLDQIALLKGSVAVIQPTLFEGGPGGGAVYDAISLGVPALVSDIPVNREIAEGDIRYFATKDVEGLKTLMVSVLTEEKDRASNDQLLEAGARRLERLGNCLYALIDELLSAKQHVCK